MKLPTVPIVVAAVIVVAVGGFYFTGFDFQTGTQSDEPVTLDEFPEDSNFVDTGIVEASASTSFGISEETLTWVESMRTEDGSFYRGVACDADSCVTFGDETIFYVENAGLYLAYSEAAEVTGNQAYVSLADQEFATMQNVCADILEGNCGHFGFLAYVDRYEETGDETLLPIITELRDEFVEHYITTDFDDFAIVGTEFIAAAYEVDGEQSTLDNALTGLEKAREVAAGNTLRDFTCKLKSVETEVYDVSGDETILEDVKSFFDENDVVEDAKQKTVLEPVLDCSDALLRLYDATGDEIYKEQSQELFDHIVATFRDTPGSNAFFTDLGKTEMRVTDALRIAQIGIELSETNGEEDDE